METNKEQTGGLAKLSKEELIQIILRKDDVERASSKRIKELEKEINKKTCLSHHVKHLFLK